MRNISRLAILLKAVLLIAAVGVAQSPATPAQSSSANSQETSPAMNSSTSDTEPHTAPVFWVSTVEIFRSAHPPALDVIRVRGYTSTEGWESGELVPITKGIPADGILDLAFVATAPENNTTPSQFPMIEAVFTLEPGHPFKGVRVHGASNRVFVNTIPGYVEAAAPPLDCAACTGKYLVRKGATAPANRGKDSIVREEELPQKARILRDSEGIGTLESDPNRLTVLLNDKGEIVAALWD